MLQSRFLRYNAVRDLLIFSILTVVLFGLIFVAIGNRRADTRYSHTSRTIEMAYNWTHCDQFSALRDIGLRSYFDGTPNPLDTNISDLALIGRSSPSEYCGGSFEPFQNEDSALFYLMSGVLFVTPNASAMGVFWSLSALMVLCFASFLIVLWHQSQDPYVTAMAAIMSIGLYTTLAVDQFLSIRTFMWPLLLLVVALLIRSQAAASYRVLIIGTAGAGAIAAIGINLRASYIAHYLVVLGIVIAMAFAQQLRKPNANKRQATGRAMSGLLAFIIGMYVIQTIFIGPLSNLDVESGLTHHPIAHPIVLGLSVPTNPLSEREGIFWSDPAGAVLAERVDPLANTTYERYESALFKYYRGLWADHPGEMLGIYARKIHDAGTYEMSFLRSRLIGFLSPASAINSGYFYIVFMVVAALSYILNFRSGSNLMQILVAAITGAALIDFVQAAAIYPRPSLYYPVLIFGLAFSTALIWSVVIYRFNIVDRLQQRILNQSRSNR